MDAAHSVPTLSREGTAATQRTPSSDGFPPRRRALVFAFAAACAALVIGLGGTYAYLAWQRSSERLALAVHLTGGDPHLAPDLARRYGCGGCHVIPGMRGADGRVGESLAGVSSRVFIAGALRNTPDNLIQWIVNPQAINPRSAMPITGIDDAQARHIAAYLYAQE